jgi:hypothetical protein
MYKFEVDEKDYLIMKRCHNKRLGAVKKEKHKQDLEWLRDNLREEPPCYDSLKHKELFSIDFPFEVFHNRKNIEIIVSGV